MFTPGSGPEQSQAPAPLASPPLTITTALTHRESGGYTHSLSLSLSTTARRVYIHTPPSHTMSSPPAGLSAAAVAAGRAFRGPAAPAPRITRTDRERAWRACVAFLHPRAHIYTDCACVSLSPGKREDFNFTFFCTRIPTAVQARLNDHHEYYEVRGQPRGNATSSSLSGSPAFKSRGMFAAVGVLGIWWEGSSFSTQTQSSPTQRMARARRRFVSLGFPGAACRHAP